MNNRIKYLLSKNQDLNYETVVSLSKLDPSKELKYLSWIVNLYKKDGLLNSDLSIVKQVLSSFDENKNTLPAENKDINKFKSILHVSNFLFEFEKNKKIDENKFLEQGVIKLYEDFNSLFIKPFTRESGVKYGKTTTWCTSSVEVKLNQFYNYLSRGDLFIFINKNLEDSDKNKKNQIFFSFNGESIEIKNSLNQDISISDFIKNNNKAFKTIMHYESVQNAICKNIDLFECTENPTKEQILSVCRQNPEYFYKLKPKYSLDKDIQMAYFVNSVLKRKGFNVLDAFKKIKNPYSELIEYAINIESEVAFFIQDKKGKLNINQQHIVVRNKPSNIYKIKNPHHTTQKIALSEIPEYILEFPNPTYHQISRAVHNNSDLLLTYIKKSKTNPKELLNIILKHAYNNETIFKKYHKLFNEKQIKNIIRSRPFFVLNLKSPSIEIQKTAVNSNFNSYFSIKKPHDSIKLLYEKNKLKSEQIENDLVYDPSFENFIKTSFIKNDYCYKIIRSNNYKYIDGYFKNISDYLRKVNY
jgi:hypothetical protein